MKIGILTFHWATNYGAVLQTYALQTYLKSKGHEVYVIDYKPRHFDNTFWNYLKNRKFLNHRKYQNTLRKERVLQIFRDKYLQLTTRIFTKEEIPSLVSDYDVLITGSDQVLNPSFLFNGEGRRKLSTAYFLDIPFNGTKIGYAVSFGCTTYPEDAKSIVTNIINEIDKIGVRENTGLDILKSVQYNNHSLAVPDPTILCYDLLFNSIEFQRPDKTDYYCAYILHKKIVINADNVMYIDEQNNPLSMEAWLGTIAYSKGLITNSYHGMIMALLNHVPFVAITVNTGSIGMNDRFTTILGVLGLEDRICCETDDYMSIINNKIDWTGVDNKIKKYSEIGRDFLNI